MRTGMASLGAACLAFTIAGFAAAGDAIDAVAVYDAVAPSVGLVVTFDDERYPVESGAGFFVGSPDVFVTQLHLFAGAAAASIKTADGSYVDVVGILGHDAATDLVALRTEDSGVQPAELAAARARVGATVVLGGSVDGMATAFGLGTVADTLSDAQGNRFYALDAPLDVWNAGAPVLDADGAVVGVAAHTPAGPVAITAQAVSRLVNTDAEGGTLTDAVAAATNAGLLGGLVNPARDLPSIDPHDGATPGEKAALLVALALFVVGGYELATSISP